MKSISRDLLFSAAGCAAALLLASRGSVATIEAQAGTGTIVGHVRLTGLAPANPIIRMGGDPRCGRALAGKRLTQEIVVRSADGGLANTFVNLQGSFPSAPAPAQPVAIDQQGCLFVPRMVGARVGQTLQITNSDPTGHNVHSLSTRHVFNVSQPVKGMVNTFPLKSEDVVMRIRCDIHSWMIAYVGVVTHPYFAVSALDGAFTMARVPAGRHTIQTWHEQYGRLTRTVDVKAGQTATVDFAYTGNEKPSSAGLTDLVIPGDGQSVTLIAGR
ncbi:MAG: carboxypeptidase regulatory-like domain-containing protein [Vicinamibacterales bacterium]